MRRLRFRSRTGSAVALALLAFLGFLTAVASPASTAIKVLPRVTTDRPDDISGSQIHIIYAIPSDGTDRALDTNGTLVASVNAWNGWLASQTTGLGGLRLDTSGGSLDITFFQDPHTNAEISARGAFVRDQLESDLHAAGFNEPGKIYAVYYDGTSTYACGGGAWPPTVPGNVAAMYLHGLPDSPVPCDKNQFAPGGNPGYLDYAMLHEIMHTMGFVPACAPHAFAAGHVSDSPTDLMYAGTQPWNPSVLDVGHDDYFKGGITGCLDLANSPYLAGNAPTTPSSTTSTSTSGSTTTTSTSSSTTTKTTTGSTSTTSVQPIGVRIVSAAVLGHGKKRVLSVRIHVSDAASVHLVFTGGGREERAKRYAVKTGQNDLRLSIGGASAGTGRLKITVAAAHYRPATLTTTVAVPA